MAAALQAPIGAVLFALEEASSFWSHKVVVPTLYVQRIPCASSSQLQQVIIVINFLLVQGLILLVTQGSTLCVQ